MFGFIRRRKHNRLQELLSAYIDGEASNSEVIEVEEHLSGCDECRAELDSLRATASLLRRLPQLDVPRSFVLTEAPAMVIQRPPSIVWSARLATSAAALLLVALLLGDTFGILSQTELAQEATRTLQVAPAPAPSGLPGQPGLPGQVEQSASVPAPAATAVPQLAARAAEAPPMPNPTPQPPVQAAAAPQAPQAASAPAAAMAPAGATPSETPAPETMMAAAVPATADDSSTVMSSADAPEAAVTPQPLGEKVASEGVVVTPGPEIQLGGPFVQSNSPNQIEEQESDGVVLPLRQLEIAMGALLAVLILATLWIARPRSG